MSTLLKILVFSVMVGSINAGTVYAIHYSNDLPTEETTAPKKYKAVEPKKQELPRTWYAKPKNLLLIGTTALSVVTLGILIYLIASGKLKGEDDVVDWQTLVDLAEEANTVQRAGLLNTLHNKVTFNENYGKFVP
jgi:hypothetical protein